MTTPMPRSRPTFYRLAALLIIFAIGLALAAPADGQTVPKRAYSSYLGGASDDDARAVAVDSLGNIYVAGTTYSIPFPGTSGSRNDTNAFVTKLDPTGATVLYSVLVGGSDDEAGLALAVDAQGNAWLAGYTRSDDLPLKNALSTTFNGDDDTFVTKLGPGGGLLLQTYLGEAGSDQADGLAVDAQGNAYLAGSAAADYGPVVMVKKIKANGSGLAYQAFFGRAERGFAKGSRGHGIAVDAQGNAYIAGETNTGGMELDGFQKQCAGYDNPIDDCPSDDGFVAALNAAGNAIIGGTLLGGLAGDVATSVALDADRNVYVAGTTFSTDFPTKNPWQAEKRGPDNFADAFLVKLPPLALTLSYGTYYGGEEYDEAYGVAAGTNGRAYLTGLTSSSDLPVPGAFQPAIKGICVTGSTERYCYDGFVAGFGTSGALGWASYIGGSDDDLGRGVAARPNGDVYVVGRAASFGLPTTPGAFQPSKAGSDDAFVLRVSTNASAPQLGKRIFVPLARR